MLTKERLFRNIIKSGKLSDNERLKDKKTNVQRKERRKKEKFVREPMNIAVLQKKAIYKLNYEAF
jgi:hypothetical protein